MKSIILSAAFALLMSVAFSTTVTITNTGQTFTPATVSIQLGDSVKFQIGSFHNVVEVSQATWNANDSTHLPGFSLPFGGGLLTGLTAGTHYYVCAPHASAGMKGQIIVNTPSGISKVIPTVEQIIVYPNPTTGKFVVEYVGTKTGSDNQPAVMEIYNFSGKSVYTLPILNEQTSVDLSAFPAGSYFVNINDNKKILTKTILKQ